MINTGRADMLKVTVGGKEVAPLGDGKLPIVDVGVSAIALTSRNQTSPQSAPQTGNNVQ